MNFRKMCVAMTLTLVSVVAMSAPGGRVEVTRKVEEQIKKGQEYVKTYTADAGQRQKVRDQLSVDLIALSSGKINSAQMKAALDKTVSVKNSAGVIQEVKMLEVAQVLRDVDAIVKATKAQKDLSADATAHLKVMEELSQVGPQFLTLAKNLSKRTVTTEENLDVFAKQMLILRDSIGSMDTAGLTSHVEVMKLAVEISLRNPEMSGDAAYDQALTDKYGKDASKKKKEILGCKE
jgi:hypothetical protein